MARIWFADTTCPSCGSENTTPHTRKKWVTALYRCEDCNLRFRVPKDSVGASKRFYQRSYSAGFTTDCPNDEKLAHLKSVRFQGTEKDFSNYIQVLQSLGITPGQTILDFGASWGYGSWQLSQAGYKVYSSEISVPRARYAAEKLGCHVLQSVDELPEQVDCFFSAHVIEHMPDPNILWKTASSTLKKSGVVALFAPNGEPEREKYSEAAYHQLWGEVHPLLLNAKALQAMAQRFRFEGIGYSSPYDLAELRHGDAGHLLGAELLFVAKPFDP